MLAGYRQRVAQLLLPGRQRLAGARIDEIEREALEGRARDVDRRLRLGDGVDAPERLQDVVAQRLHAERHAIDTRRAIAAKAGRLDAARVGLERDLGAGLDAPQRRDLIEDRRDRLRLHQRRRAAAEEDAGNDARPGALRRVPQLAQEGGTKARLVDAAEADVAVEVAVGALLGAERPVHIDAEAGVVGTNPREAHRLSRPHRARPA